ncbi:MAG: sugar phosphate nucleotidyltransferase [Myxococcales bacterium]
MKAMVLAAGMGMRMGGLTLDRPKPMLEVNGTPILGHILRNLSKHGFHDVAVNLHHHPEAIRDFFGDGTRWGVRIRYFPESTNTAGAIA